MIAFFEDGRNIWSISAVVWVLSVLFLYHILVTAMEKKLTFLASIVVSLALCMGSGYLIANKVDPGWNTGEEMCGNCEELIDEDASFCHKCGFELHSICGACGARLDEAAEFCSVCGEKVKG